MDPYTDSSDRKPADLVLFGLGFAGFLLAFWGIILTSPATALAGAAVFLAALVGFRLRRSPGEA